MCQTFSVSNRTLNDNMLSRKKALQSILLTIIPSLGICSVLELSSCIQYETYTIYDYKDTPLDIDDDWFRYRFHYSPRRITRVGVRSRRKFGCCDPNYRYKGFPDFGCQPVCSPPCPNNSHCSAPNQCSCDVGYYSALGSDCVLKEKTTEEYIQTTTVENKAIEPPCNNSCSINEECSASENVCVCRDGFRRSANAICVRNCQSQCPKNSHCSDSGQCSCDNGYHNVTGSDCVLNEETTEENIRLTLVATKIVQLPCNGSCGTNEVCSASDNTCTCKDGFQRSVGKTNTTCVPKCEPECQQADCTSPNTCECWPHYERTNSSFCRMQCSELSCVYGDCDEKGACICTQGFLNNGTACIWAGDAILTEPDDCDCWSKFVRQRNFTDDSEQRCLPLCDGDEPFEVASECINSTQCQCYEGVLVCHEQIYKCSTRKHLKAEVSTNQLSAKNFTTDKDESPLQQTLLIVGSLAGILIIVVVILWAWNKRRNSFKRLWNYGHMEREQEDEQI